MFELLQLLHPLLDDVLDFRLGDHQDFLVEEPIRRQAFINHSHLL